MKNNTPQLQPSLIFSKDLLNEVSQASQKIWIETMIFEYGPYTHDLEQRLIQKAQEGIDVRLYIDWIQNRSTHGRLHMLPITPIESYAYKLQQETKKMLKRLEQGGVKLTITNSSIFTHTPLPYLQRNHRKIIVIDDRSAWIGGKNIIDGSLTIQDIMVKFSNKEVIDTLSKVFLSANKKLSKNLSYKPNNSEVLVDNGIYGDSLIYKKALYLVKQAKKRITFVSQMLPDKQILNGMIKANKQVKIRVITSPENARPFHHYPDKYFYDNSLSRIKKYPHIKLHYSHTYIHAKILIVDNTVMFGSHNFVWFTSLIGTEEIALKTQNYSLLKQFEDFVEKL